MRAVVVTEFGGAEVLREVQDAPEPKPRKGEILVDVAYAGVNFVEALLRKGAMPGLRPPFIVGLEVSGHVAAVGEGVVDLEVGQPVAAFTQSGYAQRVVVRSLLSARLDQPGRTVTLEQAVAVPCTAVTAYQMLAHVARMRAGENVLVHGAAGGVGTMAGQIAAALGARRIIGTVSDMSKSGFAREHGYTDVVERKDFIGAVRELTGGRGVDIVLEAAGGEHVQRSLQVTAPLGRVIYFGDPQFTTAATLSIQSLRSGNQGVLGFSLGNLCNRAPESWRPSAEAVLALVSSGRLKTTASRLFPLQDAAEAHRFLESGTSVGKLALKI